MINKLPVFLFALALLGCSKSPEGKQIWAKPYLGQPAPAITVEKWITPEPDTTGKFILVDFWATWCPPCLESIPELNDFQEKFRDKLVVIGLTDESADTVRAMKQPKIAYAVATDTQGRMKKALEITGIPHVLVIDPHGIVRWEGLPTLQGSELTADVLRNLIDTYGK